MPSKLLFKGDKDRKKKVRVGGKDDVVVSNKQTVRKNVREEPEDGWVDAETLDDLVGPCFISQYLNGRVNTLSLDTSRQAAMASLGEDVPTICCVQSLRPPTIALDDEEIYQADGGNGGEKATTLLDLVEPEKAEQVWRLTRLPAAGLHLKGNIPLSDKFTLKSSFGRFLACDQFGGIDASREARSMLEEWTLALVPDTATWALRSSHGTYLSFLLEDQKVQLRGDSPSIGPSEGFKIKVQAQNRKKARLDNTEQTAEMAPSTGIKRGLTDEDSTRDGTNLKRDKYCW